MKRFDSHCHLDDKSYSRDLDNVIKRANNAGVARLMSVGVNGKTSARAVELSRIPSGDLCIGGRPSP